MINYESEDAFALPHPTAAILHLLDQGDAHLAELRERYGSSLLGCPVAEVARFNLRSLRIQAMNTANAAWLNAAGAPPYTDPEGGDPT